MTKSTRPERNSIRYRDRISSLGERDRFLRAVAFRVSSLRLLLTGDVFDKHDRVPNLVGVEDVRRQGVATPVADAAICVDSHPGHDAGTGNVSGSDSTDRSAAVKVNSVPGLIW
jgi:hypothetical protein